MIHTQLSLPQDIYRDIELMAKAHQRPTNQIVRELVAVGVKQWRLRQVQPTKQGLGQLAKLGIKGPADLATHLDDYDYSRMKHEDVWLNFMNKINEPKITLSTCPTANGHRHVTSWNP